MTSVAPAVGSDRDTRTLIGIRLRTASAILGALVAVKIAFLFVFAWNTRFVMDEFAQLGWAKYLGNGLFESVWPAKAVGYAVFYKLAHLVGWDAQSILLVGRMQTALLACATLAIIYSCARALGGDRLRGLTIILVLLCFSNFIERIFRTIAEPLAVFFAAAALLVILRGHADKVRTLAMAGALSGLAFLATQKAVYLNVALGVALAADAALARRYYEGAARGAWLVAGWLAPIVAYCFIFGGTQPIPVALSIVLGPVEVATQAADAYHNLRQYVVQTLGRNAVLYAFCFAGMTLALVQVRDLDQPRRIALIFTLVITALVFAHDQPWPYVFLMALPFIALWPVHLMERFVADRPVSSLLWLALGIAVLLSFARNLLYLRHGNQAQLELVARAESVLKPSERYFDGIGMLPNRAEPSTLWLDRTYVLRTLREGRASQAYRLLAHAPPKVIMSSYRTDAIWPVIGPLVERRYARISPNLWVAGQRLVPGSTQRFRVPFPGRYVLYTEGGELLNGEVEVNGKSEIPPFRLGPGEATLSLPAGTASVLLLPAGLPSSAFEPGAADLPLFAGVYD